MTELKRFSLVKPSLQTRFHIDFDWWGQNDRNWRVDLFGFLCPEHRETFAEIRVLKEINFAPVAQRTEQRSSKPKVVGSNPAGGALAGD